MAEADKLGTPPSIIHLPAASPGQDLNARIEQLNEFLNSLGEHDYGARYFAVKELRELLASRKEVGDAS